MTKRGESKRSSLKTASSSTSSMLPASLDVKALAEARLAEIAALERSLKNAHKSDVQRAFQSVSRDMRRRSASHHTRRVPLKLRARARAELMKVPIYKKRKSRAMAPRKYSKRAKALGAFLRRQQKSRWLETHVWHAKRMHMHKVWGFSLAQTPTQKSFRKTYRSLNSRFALHDASYKRWISLRGPPEQLCMCVDAILGRAPGWSAAHCALDGSRALHTHVHKKDCVLGPCMVIWQGDHVFLRYHPAMDKLRGQSETQGTQHSQHSQHSGLSQDESFKSHLKHTISSLKESTHDFSVNVCENLDLLSFELYGPRAGDALQQVLYPEPGTSDTKKDAFDNLHAANSCGFLLGLCVGDPRLCMETPAAADDIGVPPLRPSSSLASTDVFETCFRGDRSVKPRFSQKAIDQRKNEAFAKNPTLLLTRKQPLAPSGADDWVPVLLVRTEHGWTLLVPRFWGMPFWMRLAGKAALVLGQHELAHTGLLNDSLVFPFDYVQSPAGTQTVANELDAGLRTWLRRPPNKRVSDAPYNPDLDTAGLYLSTQPQPRRADSIFTVNWQQYGSGTLEPRWLRPTTRGLLKDWAFVYRSKSDADSHSNAVGRVRRAQYDLSCGCIKALAFVGGHAADADTLWVRSFGVPDPVECSARSANAAFS